MDRDKEERHLTRVKHEITGYAEDSPRQYPVPYATRADYELADDGGSVDIRKYFELFQKHWKLIVVCVVLGVVLAALWTTSRPRYIVAARQLR